ncbi:hypothetical protein [Dyadobacter sp.]|uniref:hypothetical protein n=1 Tax=Dyadobacter sp. TaxID=1914288 RepID=UPI003F711A14
MTEIELLINQTKNAYEWTNRLFDAVPVDKWETVPEVVVAELNNPLEPTPTPHPIATTKFEAIDWNIKHTMYHCGQIGMISRVVEKRYDFGLRLAQ